MDKSKIIQVEDVRREIARFDALLRRYAVRRLSIFGSVSRGEASARSDVDMLVEFGRPQGLMELVALEHSLSRRLGRKVDLLTEAAISPLIRDRIHRDLQVVYEPA